MAKRNKTTIRWRDTAIGQEAYRKAREDAQIASNRDGFDRGLEIFDDIPKMECISVRTLPQRQNRYGHETRCEVVSCEILERCQPGHGAAR